MKKKKVISSFVLCLRDILSLESKKVLRECVNNSKL